MLKRISPNLWMNLLLEISLHRMSLFQWMPCKQWISYSSRSNLEICSILNNYRSPSTACVPHFGGYALTAYNASQETWDAEFMFRDNLNKYISFASRKIKQQKPRCWNDHRKIKKATEKVKKKSNPKKHSNRTFIQKAKIITSWFAIWFPAPVYWARGVEWTEEISYIFEGLTQLKELFSWHQQIVWFGIWVQNSTH